MQKLKTSDSLLQALNEALEWVKTMSPEDAAKMREAQRESYVRSITGGLPRRSSKRVNGLKVYASWPESDD